MTEIKMFFIITLFQDNPKNILLHLIFFFQQTIIIMPSVVKKNLSMKNSELTDTFQGFKTFS